MLPSIPKLLCVVGARPNFVKIAPLLNLLKLSHPPVNVILVHTGQHFDYTLNQQLFSSLGISAPKHQLKLDYHSEVSQFSDIMIKFESVINEEKPNAILVVGDVNSTLSCALTASKKNIPLIHIESGLRSFDKNMPEEINRILTDQLSDLLFTTELSANINLQNEGIESNKVHFVGNIMIDSLLQNLDKSIHYTQTLSKYSVNKSNIKYILVTLHRKELLNNDIKIKQIILELKKISEDFEIIIPLHPRTHEKLKKLDLYNELNDFAIILPPVDYLEMLGLIKDSTIILTDSGGLQEEATILKKPCITLRDNTERPVTVSEGTNRVLGNNIKLLPALIKTALSSDMPKKIPTYWDGHTAARIMSILVPWLYEIYNIAERKYDKECIKY